MTLKEFLLEKRKYLEKFRQREASKLISVFANQGFMSLATFLTNVVLARSLFKEDYANFVLLMSLTVFVLGIQSSMITVPYAIALNDFSLKEKKAYFASNIFFKYIFTIISIIVLFVVLFFAIESKFIEETILHILYIVSFTFYYFVQEMLLSNRETRRNLVNGLLCSLLLIAVLGFIYYSGHKDLNLFLLLSSLVYLSISFIFLKKEANLSKIRFEDLKNHVTVNWETGKWLMGSNFFYHFSTQIYPWLLLFLAGKEEIAVYGILISMSGLINPILRALNSYLLPLFVKMNTNIPKLRKYALKWMVPFVVFAVLLTIVGVFKGEEIIAVFFGNQYANLGFIVVLPFINQSINTAFQPVRISLNAIKRTDILFWLLIIRSIIALVLGYFFIKYYGIIGVFIVQIIENVIYQIIYLVIFKRLLFIKSTHK